MQRPLLLASQCPFVSTPSLPLCFPRVERADSSPTTSDGQLIQVLSPTGPQRRDGDTRAEAKTDSEGVQDSWYALAPPLAP
jgi:hypothetical protein